MVTTLSYLIKRELPDISIFCGVIQTPTPASSHLEKFFKDFRKKILFQFYRAVYDLPLLSFKKACLKEKQRMSGERGERKSATNCLCERPFASRRIEGMFVECFSLHLVYAHDSSTQRSVQNLTSVQRLGQNEVPGKSLHQTV